MLLHGTCAEVLAARKLLGYKAGGAGTAGTGAAKGNTKKVCLQDLKTCATHYVCSISKLQLVLSWVALAD